MYAATTLEGNSHDDLFRCVGRVCDARIIALACTAECSGGNLCAPIRSVAGLVMMTSMNHLPNRQFSGPLFPSSVDDHAVLRRAFDGTMTFNGAKSWKCEESLQVTHLHLVQAKYFKFAQVFQEQAFVRSITADIAEPEVTEMDQFRQFI